MVLVRSSAVNLDVYLKILKNSVILKFNFLLDIIVYKYYFVFFTLENNSYLPVLVVVKDYERAFNAVTYTLK